jgi:hypothetical protein
MSNTSPSPTSPVEVSTPELSSVFVSFHFRGSDNGVVKEGFDSRVIKAPSDVQITSAEDIKAVADALAQSEFNNGKKYVGLEITLLNIVRLPL